MTEMLLERLPTAYAVDMTCQRTGPHVLARLSGRLDHRASAGLVRRVRSWADDGVRAVVLDLSGLSTLDGYGLAALLRARRVLRARAGVLAVRHAPESAQPTLRRAGLLLPEAVLR